MSTIDVDPNNVSQVNGAMIAAWPAFTISRSLRRLGQQTPHEEKVTIPADFADIVEEAKAQNRQIRIIYRAILGSQTAWSVEIV